MTISEQEIKNFYMEYVHESHLLAPLEQKVDEKKKKAIFTYPLDKGSCQRVYYHWAYTVYLS